MYGQRLLSAAMIFCSKLYIESGLTLIEKREQINREINWENCLLIHRLISLVLPKQQKMYVNFNLLLISQVDMEDYKWDLQTFFYFKKKTFDN